MSKLVKRQRYRVDGDDEFLLRFAREDDGTFSIWCDDHPYNRHGGGAQDHHLYSNGQVCVTVGREPTSLDRAIAIGHVFMTSFAHWCKYGTRGRTGGKVNV